MGTKFISLKLRLNFLNLQNVWIKLGVVKYGSKQAETTFWALNFFLKTYLNSGTFLQNSARRSSLHHCSAHAAVDGLKSQLWQTTQGDPYLRLSLHVLYGFCTYFSCKRGYFAPVIIKIVYFLKVGYEGFFWNLSLQKMKSFKLIFTWEISMC